SCQTERKEVRRGKRAGGGDEVTDIFCVNERLAGVFFGEFILTSQGYLCTHLVPHNRLLK
ncbi:MAG: hypothetical protein IKT36_06195, partial [Methanocorpusculum sp.]|nr:hypothetical protein [Methanocorpusculum sp.]